MHENPAAAGFSFSTDAMIMARAMRYPIRSAALALLLAVSAPAWPQGDAKRGEYLAKAAGCMGCHTLEKEGSTPYAGGRALKTPFGTFYGPNITPHPQEGIGRWTEANFIQAMRHGLRPDGAHYFPAFPYPSFTGIHDGDLRDLWAYLRALPPSSRANQPHDLGFPYSWRFLVTFWKWLFFTPGPLAATPGVSDAVNRGAYLVLALGHCGECHTPRNFLGGPKKGRLMAGGMGPEGKGVPNLTPGGRFKEWRDQDISEFLVTGLTADGDVPAEAMGEVIRNTTSQLTPADMAAMIAYLRSLPPVADEKP